MDFKTIIKGLTQIELFGISDLIRNQRKCIIKASISELRSGITVQISIGAVIVYAFPVFGLYAKPGDLI